MKKSKFSEAQIFNILKEPDTGATVVDICRKHGISNATFYKWRAQYGGMDVSLMRKLRLLEQENLRLKKMYANSQMDNELLKEALTKI